MDFSLNEVQAMLADSIEKFLANDYDFDARQSYAGSDTGFSADVWQTFAELGWTAVPFSEEDGGFGGGVGPAAGEGDVGAHRSDVDDAAGVVVVNPVFGEVFGVFFSSFLQLIEVNITVNDNNR